MRRNSRFRRDIETMMSLGSAAPKIVAAVVGAGLALTFIQSRIGRGDTWDFASWLCLISSVGIIIGAWSYFPRKNLQYLADWSFDYRPRETSDQQLEIGVVVLIAVSLGMLLFTAWWPFYFGIVYSIYIILYFVGVHHANKNIRGAILYSRERLESPTADDSTDAKRADIFRTAYDEIEDFHYRQHHQELRIIIMGILGLAAWSLALGDILGWLDWGEVAASFIFAATLFSAEITMSIWRRNYYGRMDDLEDELEPA